MWEHAKDWAQIAPGVTPVVALIAVLVAWRQLVLNRANQRENTAKATFRDYLRLAVQNSLAKDTENLQALTGTDTNGLLASFYGRQRSF